jgi:hypothetical protein
MYNYDRRASKSGPATEVLIEHWNRLHDIERSLVDVVREYDAVAAYRGTDASRDAKAMLDSIQEVRKMLQKISMNGGAFDQLFEAEEKFVRKYGPPQEYVDARSREMYPR